MTKTKTTKTSKKTSNGKAIKKNKNQDINENLSFNIVLVSTMSSGKSTFINSLIGQELLPSQNQACTAKVSRVINIDGTHDFKGYPIYNEGERKRKRRVSLTKSLLEKWNAQRTVTAVDIEGDILGIRNLKKRVVLVDTPGTNYAADESHKEVTYNLLRNLDSGVILYLLNAMQLGINDDYELLQHISKVIKKSKGNLDILFVLNKSDALKENVDGCMFKLIKGVNEYLSKNNLFSNPRIIPVSAYSAKLFRQALTNKTLSFDEEFDFVRLFNFFKPAKLDLSIYSSFGKNYDLNGDLIVQEQNYSRKEVFMALNNTAIPFVERLIEHYMMTSEFVENKNRKKGEK